MNVVKKNFFLTVTLSFLSLLLFRKERYSRFKTIKDTYMVRSIDQISIYSKDDLNAFILNIFLSYAH